MTESKKVINASKARKGLFIALIIGLIAAILIIIFTFNTKTIDFILQAHLPLMSLSLFVLFLSYLFNALTLSILSLAIGREISVLKNFIIFLAGTFASYVTPFGLGGLPTQVYLLSKSGLDLDEALAVVSSRAVISIWFFGFIAPLTAVLLGKSISLSFMTPVVSVTTVSFIFFLFLFKPRLFRSLTKRLIKNRLIGKFISGTKLTLTFEKISFFFEKFHNRISLIFKKPSYIILALITETAAWIAYILVAILIIASLGWPHNLALIYLRIVLLLAIIPFSPTPGGSGLAEGGMIIILKNLAPISLAGPAVLLWRFVTYYLILLFGGIALFYLLKSLNNRTTSR